MKYIGIILIGFIFGMNSCVPPDSEGYELRVRLQMPPETENVSPGGATVKLVNTNNGTTYTAQADAEGYALFHADYGIYRVTSQFNAYVGDLEYLFNGGIENIRLTPENSNAAGGITIALAGSRRSRIVIKEIYYAGCYDPNGKQYTKDTYISLYNNSDTAVSLDNLCIGTVALAVASKVSPWLTNVPDSLPIAYIGWRFPGQGNDHILGAGETVTIAVNAVNHTGAEYNHPNSVDLSKAGWAFYHPSLQGTDIATGVAPLYMFKKLLSMLFYPISFLGPGMILYRIPDISAEEYAANPAHIRKEPPKYTGVDYLMIHTSWVVDCVDCVEDATKQGFKRIPASLDAEATYLPSGKYSGRALRRKIAGNSNGRVVYQDTNNSFNDFEEVIPEMKPGS